MKLFYTSIYYLILIHLPRSTFPGLGKISKRMRYLCCKRIFKSCGENVNIEKGARFGKGKGIIIGNNSGIGINCRVPNNLIIGNNVMMGPDVLIFESNHEFGNINIPMIQQGFSTKKQVIIGNDVWIGERVIILPGKTIGDGTIIGAGSVVSKNIPEFVIAAGNPIRIIRERK